MSNIKPGDLVVVTRPGRCGCSHRLGHLFTVTVVRPAFEYRRCDACGYFGRSLPGDFVVEGHAEGSMSYERLTRIDPLPESEKQDNQVEVTA